MRSKLFSLVVVGLCLGVTAGAAAAPEGMTVSPASVDLVLGGNAHTQETAVGIRNDTSQALRYAARIEAAQLATNGALVPTGTPDAILSGALSISQTDFSLLPKQSINLKLRLQDSPKLPPGGRYAILLISQLGQAQGSITVRPAVGVTVFIAKEHGAIRQLEVSQIKASGDIFRLPTAATVTFKNRGNIDVVPRASVTVLHPWGKKIRTGVLNEASIRTLPNRTITIQSPLTSIGSSWIPGRYTLEVRYRYDGSDEQKVAARTFWYVPPFCLLAIPGLVIGVFFATRLWRRLRKRKRRPAAVVETPASSPKVMDIKRPKTPSKSA